MDAKLNSPSQSQTTAVVIDNFLSNPDEVRAFALKQEFAADNRYFRGQRSRERFLWPGMRERLQQLLGKHISPNWHNHATNGVFQFCIGGDQIVYHSDDNTHAAVLYLTPNAPPEAGTTLYRSRALKGRTVDEVMNIKKAAPPMREHIAAQFYAGKLLDPTAWDVIDVVGNVYNRLAIWDARLVHSASCYFGSSIETGRLFQMFFFNAE
jgi:hypothetical protein